jgi:hypothetical protein
MPSNSFGKFMKLHNWYVEKLEKAKSHLLIVIASITLLALAPLVLEATMKVRKEFKWEEEIEFVFAGKCFNGEEYWLFASQEVVDGKITPFYNYKGPVGSGTVYTDTAPKVMVQRICRANADIVSSL